MLNSKTANTENREKVSLYSSGTMAFRYKRPRLPLPYIGVRTARVFTRDSEFTCSYRAAFSTDIICEEPILVRDFIHSALYDPNHGYFSRRSGSVGVLDKSIKFGSLEGWTPGLQKKKKEIRRSIGAAELSGSFIGANESGRKDYVKYLNNLYRMHDISWFTPVELFKPWYAHGIAEAIMRTADLSIPLKIYEIGGGSGTCAKCIMDYLMLNAPPKVYRNMSYISIEISPSLAEKQLATVGEVRSHTSKFKVECRDAADRTGWGHVEPQPCWVIMLEVLDNLPHDLIYSENQKSPWKEVWLEKQRDSQGITELYKPLSDPLITRCIEIIDQTTSGSTKNSTVKSIWSKVFPKPRKAWLPTGCLQLLDVLHWALPKMSLIASDFSYLPDVKVPGVRAPLVSTKKEGLSTDYNSYLDTKGDADIFFPTDFWLLEQIDHHCSGWRNQPEDNKSKPVKKRRSITLDTSSFMEEFGLPSKTRTKDGYNPLLDDFKNTKFYLSVPTHNK